MTRWNLLPLKPNPFCTEPGSHPQGELRARAAARPGPALTSPVAKATKFSTVLGTVLPKSPMTTRPASSSPTRRSKNTLGGGGRRPSAGAHPLARAPSRPARGHRGPGSARPDPRPPPPTLAVTLGPFLRSSALEAAGSSSRSAAPSAVAATKAFILRRSQPGRSARRAACIRPLPAAPPPAEVVRSRPLRA